MNKNRNDMNSQGGVGLMVYVTYSSSYRSQISEQVACSGSV